jgi:tetratricopeptide (TPR) repeat protein
MTLNWHGEVSDLLRKLDRPHLLAGHRLLEGRVTTHPRQVVEEALALLPDRFRTILTRCDLAKERHAAVAAQLGISERHFYRERRKAMAALGESLVSLPQLRPTIGVTDVDPVDASFACAVALCNVGRSLEAIDVLDRVLAATPSGDARARIAIRLATMCCETGALDSASSYLRFALHDGNDRLRRLEAATIQAEIALHRGELDAASRELEPVVASLKALAPAPQTERARALVNAQLVAAEIADHRDAFGVGLEAAIEAAGTARLYSLEPALRLRAQLTLAQMRMLTGTPMPALLDHMAGDYDFAQKHALARDCANTAGFFCVLYSYAGQHDRALQFGRKALEIDRVVGADDRVHRYYVAWAFLRRGNAGAARTALGDIPPPGSIGDSFDYVVPRLIEAESLHLEGRSRDALAIARHAVYTMRRAGSRRGLGSALRVQAEIQGALDERGSAHRSIDEALSLLGTTGPPYALAQAYRCSGRLTGNRRHRAAAREMMELFRY